MKKKNHLLPKEFRDFDDEIVPYGARVLIYAYIMEEEKKKRRTLD